MLNLNFLTTINYLPCKAVLLVLLTIGSILWMCSSRKNERHLSKIRTNLLKIVKRFLSKLCFYVFIVVICAVSVLFYLGIALWVFFHIFCILVLIYVENCYLLIVQKNNLRNFYCCLKDIISIIKGNK